MFVHVSKESFLQIHGGSLQFLYCIYQVIFISEDVARMLFPW